MKKLKLVLEKLKKTREHRKLYPLVSTIVSLHPKSFSYYRNSCGNVFFFQVECLTPLLHYLPRLSTAERGGVVDEEACETKTFRLHWILDMRVYVPPIYPVAEIKKSTTR